MRLHGVSFSLLLVLTLCASPTVMIAWLPTFLRARISPCNPLVADTPLRVQGGNPPLLLAATGGHLNCVTALLAAGVDKESTNLVRNPAPGSVALLTAVTRLGAWTDKR